MAFEKHIYINKSRDTTSIVVKDTEPKITVSLFMALLGEYIRGSITSAQLKLYIEEALTQSNRGISHPLDPHCIEDIDTIIVTLDGLPDAPNKLMYAFQFRHVFEIAETECSLYSTSAEVKTRLGFV